MFKWEQLGSLGGSCDHSATAGRHGHSIVTYKNRVYLFGGHNGNHALNDLHAYDLVENIWLDMKTTGTPPSPRYFHSAAIIDNKMYLSFDQILKISNYPENLFLTLDILLSFFLSSFLLLRLLLYDFKGISLEEQGYWRPLATCMYLI